MYDIQPEYRQNKSIWCPPLPDWHTEELDRSGTLQHRQQGDSYHCYSQKFYTDIKHYNNIGRVYAINVENRCLMDNILLHRL
jgi:hypothetical protein